MHFPRRLQGTSEQLLQIIYVQLLQEYPFNILGKQEEDPVLSLRQNSHLPFHLKPPQQRQNILPKEQIRFMLEPYL